MAATPPWHTLREAGSTARALVERMAKPRPFEDKTTAALRRKLASGVLQPEIVELMRAELAVRGEAPGDA